MAVAIIPARGGSKRIPHKNIRSFCGKPMISYSIETALQSGCFERVIVSTDSDEIARIARLAGAETPFTRPAELSDDFATTLDVMAHAVTQLDYKDSVCCIYATAPFLSAENLNHAKSMLESGKWNYVFSATRFAFPVQRGLTTNMNGGVEMLFPEHANTRSQDLPDSFHDAGQFYWGRASAFAEKKPIFGPQSAAFLIPRKLVQDIDTEEDWEMAEKMYHAWGAAEG